MMTDRNRGGRGAKARRETMDAAWQRWQGTRVNSKSTLTHKTDASALRALPESLRTGRLSEISASDFANTVRVPTGRASRPEKQVWPFTPEEFWMLHAALVAEAGDQRASVALVMALTGLRPGELTALRASPA